MKQDLTNSSFIYTLIVSSFFILLTPITSFSSNMLYQTATLCQNNDEWPIEILTMTSHSSFDQLYTSLHDKAKREGKVLSIHGCSLLNIDTHTYGYVYLQTRYAMDLDVQWKPIGSIVSQIIYGPHAEITLKGMSFEPIGELGSEN